MPRKARKPHTKQPKGHIKAYTDFVWTILGNKKYKLYFVKPVTDKWCGYTEHPSTKDKKIYITTDQGEKATLDTLCHEALHILNWSFSEEWVARSAQQLTALLWELGYRRDPAVAPVFRVLKLKKSDVEEIEES